MSGGQRPTVGRTVLYQPDPHADQYWLRPSPPGPVENPKLAAIVTAVVPRDDGPDLVTLTVFQAVAGPVALDRMLVEGDGLGMWSWPPRT
ncbi:hypothetical protein [Methylorubrum populi]|uniref:hypothetical protein n=1 Tax=Methylorubrum populi TaxID=223967 RepID=UPI000DB68125|nr:hypothetical protein [Methylorubrum populi]PZP65542.1 MAG: hypothetical protein DI590_26835 [Methylorubrum populi]